MPQGLKERAISGWTYLRYPLGSFFAWVATIVGMLSGIVALTEYATRNSTIREWVLSMTLVTMTTVSLGTLAYRETRFSRQSKLASTLTHQQRASERLRDLRIYLRRSASLPPERLTKEVLATARSMIEEILSIYADLYSILTSTRCRTCVKMIDVSTQDSTDVAIFTLARDQLSSSENRGHDKRRAEERLDALRDNNDFVQLWVPDGQKDHYFCNDLRSEEGLETSSLNYWWNIEGKSTQRRSEWPLWYRSTIVWPVRQESRESLGIERECLGFVTVDSHLPGVFSEEDHAPLGKMLANALLPILTLYRDLDGVLRLRSGIKQ